LTGPFVRYSRAGLLEVIAQDYLTTARAKGLRSRLVIVRHALPERRDGDAATADPPLSESGRRQAAATADFLFGEHIDHIVSSPLRRAIETAEVLAKRIEAAPVIGDEVQTEQGGCCVEGLARRILRIALDEGHAAGCTDRLDLPPRLLEHLAGWIHPDEAPTGTFGCEEGQLDTAARSDHEDPAPIADTVAQQDGRHRVAGVVSGDEPPRTLFIGRAEGGIPVEECVFHLVPERGDQAQHDAERRDIPYQGAHQGDACGIEG